MVALGGLRKSETAAGKHNLAARMFFVVAFLQA